MKILVLAVGVLLGTMSPLTAATDQHAQSPDFDVTALTDSDVELSPEVMRTALYRLMHACGRPRETIDLVKAINDRSHPVLTGGSISDRELRLLNFALRALTHIDERVAAERGVEARYIAIRWGIRNRLGFSNGCFEKVPVCGRGGDCSSSPSPIQVALMNREKAARAQDKKFIDSHCAEIESLTMRFDEMLVPRWP